MLLLQVLTTRSSSSSRPRYYQCKCQRCRPSPRVWQTLLQYCIKCQWRQPLLVFYGKTKKQCHSLLLLFFLLSFVYLFRKHREIFFFYPLFSSRWPFAVNHMSLLFCFSSVVCLPYFYICLHLPTSPPPSFRSYLIFFKASKTIKRVHMKKEY